MPEETIGPKVLFPQREHFDFYIFLPHFLQKVASSSLSAEQAVHLIFITSFSFSETKSVSSSASFMIPPAIELQGLRSSLAFLGSITIPEPATPRTATVRMNPPAAIIMIPMKGLIMNEPGELPISIEAGFMKLKKADRHSNSPIPETTIPP